MKTLIDLFKTFEKQGNKEVFVYRTGIRRFTLTYSEIYDLSLRMARFLEEKGIKKGDRVAIWAGNSPWWAVSFFGILAKGAIVVPIDFASGKKRAETIVKLSGAKFIIQSNYKFEKLTSTDGLRTVMVENLFFLLRSQSFIKKLPIIKASDIVEIVYTSGTTGDPKGVILSHKNIISNILGACNHIELPKNFIFLSVLPLSHMLEQTIGFLVPLFRGDKIIYLRTVKPSSIMGAFGKENICAMLVVPKFLLLLKNTIERELEVKHLKVFLTSELLRKAIAPLVRRKFGSKFQMFMTGGAAMPVDVFKFWKEMGIKVIEGYGLTECSPLVSANSIEEQIPGSVGKPLKGLRVRLDNQELLVKGDSVFSGYYQNLQESEKAFKDRWFKTGDFAEITTDGRITIKGRKKDVIVNASGINIYPDEIEAVINRIDGIRDSCVIGLDRGEGEEVHVVLLLKNKNADIHKIIKSANEKLDPLQQIEGFFVWSDFDFPRTTTLKIQKFRVKEKLLRENAKQDWVSKDVLLSLLANVSRRSEAEIKEGSLLTSDLGLNSLSRLELINYLEQEYRVDLEDTAINQTTRVKDLRVLITKGEKNKTPNRFKFWTNTQYGVAGRKLLDNIFHFPFIDYFFDLRVEGLRNLRNINGPVIFIPNHIGFLDQPAIMRVMPEKLRYSTSTAAKEELFFEENLTLFQKFWKRLIFLYTTFAFNSFLLPQRSGFRKSLSYMGKLIDHNINILVFPEGHRSKNGKMQDFMPGLGLMVKELQVPVVPIRIIGIENIFPRGAKFPKKGKCTVIFGEPIEFTTETPSEIVEKSRDAILNLTSN